MFRAVLAKCDQTGMDKANYTEEANQTSWSAVTKPRWCSLFTKRCKYDNMHFTEAWFKFKAHFIEHSNLRNTGLLQAAYKLHRSGQNHSE